MKHDYYIGVDLGKQSSYFVIKNDSGELQKRMKILNDSVEIKKILKPYLEKSCKAVIEATCNYYWMHQQLVTLGCEVVLAHPLKTRAIADAKVKNDRLDATILCDLLRGDLIPESYVPPEDIRSLRELVRQHIRLVQMRTQVKNQVHAVLTKLNYLQEDSDLFGKKGMSWLLSLPLPKVYQMQCQQAILQIQQFNQLITQTDQHIRESLKQFPQAKQLREIPGIGIFSAAVLIAEIGEIQRFNSPKKLVSYAGIAPGLYESGKTSHRRGITRQGNNFLRWILCEMTQVHIRKAGPLRQFFLRLKERIGYTKALVATARKLLTGVYFVLKGKDFVPYLAG